MTGSDIHRVRVARSLVAIAVLLGGAACNDYPRTNPLDAGATVSLVLDGPDSVTAVGDTVTFELRSAQGESFTDYSSWAPPEFLRPLDRRGHFIVTGTRDVARATGTIMASLNANVASKTITYSLQPASLTVDDCYNERKVLFFPALLIPSKESVGAQFVCVTLKDRRGFRLPDVSSVSRTIRDQRVLRFVDAVGNLNAVAVGSTYVVYARSGLVDSVRVDIRQVPARLTRDPPACASRAALPRREHARRRRRSRPPPRRTPRARPPPPRSASS